jgi:hypothetical protein
MYTVFGKATFATASCSLFSSFYVRIFRHAGEAQHTYLGASDVVATIHSVHSHNIASLLHHNLWYVPSEVLDP